MALQLTTEQKAVIESDAAYLSVSAFAGTGKTTTLKAYAEARPKSRGLYIAFNRSAAESAQRCMPSNVIAKTSHALAFREVGKLYKHKLAPKLRPKDVMEFVDGNSAYLKAKLIVSIIEKFMQSSSFDVEGFCLDMLSKRPFSIDKQMAQFSHDDEIIETVTSLWKRMIDIKDSFPVTHDVYFKLWQLSKPVLKCDFVLLDEAQDTNPALFDVFARQSHAHRVLVGDEHQAIYAFRGAMNAMAKAREDRVCERLYLTRSFRFGQEIADIATKLLRTYKGEMKVIIGTPQNMDKKTTCHLFRTNAGLFVAAYDLIRNGKSLNFVGGFDSYPFMDIVDTYFLKAGKQSSIINPFVRSFDSFDSLVKYAEETEDNELLVRIDCVERFGKHVLKMFDHLQKSYDAKSAQAVSTVHKAKGLEWGCVKLGDDFVRLLTEREGEKQLVDLSESRTRHQKNLTAEEVNIWYVAITRAQVELKLNDALKEFLEFLSNRKSATIPRSRSDSGLEVSGKLTCQRRARVAHAMKTDDDDVPF